MPMESETISMLIWGFIIIIGLGGILVLRLMFKSRNKAFLWFMSQFLFLLIAFIKILNLIQSQNKIPQSMLSEENSLAIGFIGVFWGTSMVCMFIGIWHLTKDWKSHFS